MKKVNFMAAIDIIGNSHSNNIIINKVLANQQVPKNLTIHIVDCVPAVINKLIEAKFSLSMDNGFLSVTDTFRD